MPTTPMPVTASELVSRLFDVIDSQRWDELASVFDENALVYRPGADPLRGIAAIEDFYRHQRPIVSGRHAITRVVSDLGVAACWGHFSGQDRAGRTVAEQIAEVYLVRDGRIAERTTYLHR